MKRLIALFAALTLVFACGCSGKTDDSGTDNNNVSDNQNGMIEDDTATSDKTPGDVIREDADDMGDAAGDAIDDAGEAVENGADRMDEALTGDQTENSAGTDGAAADPEK